MRVQSILRQPLVFAVVLALTVMACGTPEVEAPDETTPEVEDPDEPTPEVEDPDETTPEVEAPEIDTVEPGVLTVAFPGDWPMTALEDDALSGFDGDMVNLMAERLGLSVNAQLMEFSAGIESVQTGRADMLIGAVGWTAERAEVMYLTDEIYYINVGVAQKVDRNIQTFEDMEGLIGGTVVGFAIIPEIELAPIQDLRLYDTEDALYRDIAAERIDFGVANPFRIEGAAAQNPEWEIKSLPVIVPEDLLDQAPLMGQKVLYIMAVNRDRQALGEALSAEIRNLWDDCENVTIVEQYIGTDDSFWTPPPDNRRVGVDRPEGYEPPTLGAC